MLRGAAHLELICRKCTRSATFPAPTAKLAADAAIKEGWKAQSMDEFTCPKCSHPVVEPRRVMLMTA